MSTEDTHRGSGLHTVGIVGAGLVGTYVAAAAARSDRQVTVTDLDPRRASEVAGRLGEPAQAVGAIADLAGCDVLIEAVTEDRETKVSVLAALAEHADALLVTTTSAFTVTELAAAIATPDRLVGVHVMPATPGARLAEIAAGEHTSDAVVARVQAFCVELGWTPLTVEDQPGRLTRRLAMPFFNQAVQAYADGLAFASDIDRVVELGLGHRRGPLAVLDNTGLDDHLAATSHTYAAVHDRALAPPPLLARMVAAGRCGDKTGTGFHAKEQQ